MVCTLIFRRLVYTAKIIMSKRKCESSRQGIEDESRLVEAAQDGNYAEVLHLLDKGVSPDAAEYKKMLFYKSENYMTPLHYAVKMNHPQIVKLLLEREATVDALDRFDVTPLHTAAELGHEECLKLLLDGGADCNISTKFSKHGSYTAVPHPGGTTPLHLAASNNHVSCVRLLIWYGADYNAVDERCRTSLYIAAEKALADCVHAHLDNAIWKDILSLPEKYSGNTPLHECVRHKMLDCVTRLLQRGSDVNHLNHTGCSPLHLAVEAGDRYSIDIIRQLVVNGYNTDVNLPHGHQNYTPLHYVCFNDTRFQERRPEAAVLLLSYGANFTIANKHGDSLLQCEMQSPHNDMTILHTLVQCFVNLPSLESLSLGLSLPNSNPVLNPRLQLQLQHFGHQYEEQQYIHPQQLHQRQQQLQQLQQLQQQQQQQAEEDHVSKLMWYRSISKGPMLLQHYCRCMIRNTLGAQRLRKVETLVLPKTLKEYLLFQNTVIH